MAEEDDLDLDVEKKGGGGKKILIFSLIGILVIGASIGTTVALLGGGDDTEQAGDEEGEEGDKAEKKGKKKKKKKKKKKSKDPIVPHYKDLDPIVVNLNDPESGVRFLQVAFTIMTTSAANDEKAKLHMPVIKHHLNLLLSSQKFNSLKTREGKIKLQQDALKAVHAALKEVDEDEDVVKQIFIRSIVGQ